MEKLQQEGKHSLFSCSQKRPTYLFHDDLCRSLQKDGDSQAKYGLLNGDTPFLVNAFQSKGRKLCIMSTCFSDEKTEKEFEILVEDGSEENQSQYEEIKEIRPLVRAKYSEIMDFVDRADQHTMGALVPNRKKHWTTAEKIWEITMLLMVNTRKVFESASSTSDICGSIWQKMIC